jgi:endonuclease YncB( thermonuclease family)
MAELFAFIFLISLVCLVVGLIRPAIFTKLFRDKPKRKQIGVVFGVITFISLMIGVAASPTPEESQDIKPELVAETVETTESTANTPVEENIDTPEPESVPVVPVLPTPSPADEQSSITQPDVKQEPNPARDLFQVTEVVDGDTIKVSTIGTLRLIGMDTPETRDPRKPVQCFGREASNKAKELLSGKKVYLEYDPAQKQDKYGRTLAYVYREDGLFYNAEMIKQGFAHSYVQFPHPRLDEFNTYQQEARDNNRGFWATNTCSGNTTQAASGSSKTTIPLPISPEVNKDGFIKGSCASLKKLGLGNFERGDPNYTEARDRDEDGIACEMN